MNEESAQQILIELQKLRRSSRRFSLVALGSLFGFLIFVYLPAFFPKPAAPAPPKDPPTWAEVDRALQRLDYQEAYVIARGMNARSPHDYYGHAYLGDIHLAMGDLDKAEAEYARAFALFPVEENQKKLEAIRKRRAAAAASPAPP